ncbi:MAG: ABC transporter ATP-binding protein [Candidatus Thermoplasmatota archaeon]|nr:ABC transporter ATP-binding protein [Candidatus Thermoplasmatota archaeon]
MIRIRDFVARRGEFEVRIQELNLQGGRNFLIGRNGTGKTTLLNSIAGLINSSGTVEIGGIDINALPPERRRIGLIPQDLLLFGRMSVNDNLRMSVRYGRGDIEIYKEIVAEMHLEPLMKKRANEISLGQAQRVAIARAIISKPLALLMDEPFSFQDEIARLGLISLIDELSAKYGFDYLYATHNSRDLENGFSNLISIDNGRVIETVDTVEKIEHFRTLALLDYKNLVTLDGHNYLLDERALDFNDREGNEYGIIGIDSGRYVRFKIDGNYFFASVTNVPKGKYLKLNIDRAREIQY